MLRLICILLSILPSSASAAILFGEVTGGTAFSAGGVFVELVDLDTVVVGANRYDDANLRAFNERQNVVTDSVIQTNVGRNVEAGEVVASHYVVFDPDDHDNVEGTIYFDAPIVGVVTNGGELTDTDFLANSLVTYDHVERRGLNANDVVTLFAVEPNRLDVMILARSPGDFIRVLTETSQLAIDLGISELVAPAPSAGVLMVLGAVGWAAASRAYMVRA
ncbi:MAG: hypothetical protein AAGI89_03910 [Pseudomonadota bacterium]